MHTLLVIAGLVAGSFLLIGCLHALIAAMVVIAPFVGKPRDEWTTYQYKLEAGVSILNRVFMVGAIIGATILLSIFYFR